MKLNLQCYQNHTIYNLFLQYDTIINEIDAHWMDCPYHSELPHDLVIISYDMLYVW